MPIIIRPWNFLFILGDSQVGKTSLITNLFENHHLIYESSTDQVTKYRVNPRGTEFNILEIRDYAFFAENEIEVDERRDLAIFCYAIDNPESYNNVVEMWIPLFEEFVSETMNMGLIGKKSDLKDDDEVICNLAQLGLEPVSINQALELYLIYDTILFIYELGIHDTELVELLLEYII